MALVLFCQAFSLLQTPLSVIFSGNLQVKPCLTNSCLLFFFYSLLFRNGSNSVLVPNHRMVGSTIPKSFKAMPAEAPRPFPPLSCSLDAA